MQTNKHESKEWSMVLNHSFGDGNLNCSDVMWPGDANEVRTWIDQLQKEWRDQLAPVTDIDLRSPERTKWPFQDRPFGDGMGWMGQC